MCSAGGGAEPRRRIGRSFRQQAVEKKPYFATREEEIASGGKGPNYPAEPTPQQAKGTANQGRTFWCDSQGRKGRLHRSALHWSSKRTRG